MNSFDYIKECFIFSMLTGTYEVTSYVLSSIPFYVTTVSCHFRMSVLKGNSGDEVSKMTEGFVPERA